MGATRVVCLVVVLTGGGVAGCGRWRHDEGAAASSALREKLESPPASVARDRAWDATRRFYSHRDHRLAWLDTSASGARFEALIHALEKAESHGLDPEAYGLAELKAQREKAHPPMRWRAQAPPGLLKRVALDPGTTAELDLRLTYAFLRYGSHLLQGRVDPERIDPQWSATPRRADLADVLSNALENNRVEAALDELAPAHPGYRALAGALSRYKAIAAGAGWPPMSSLEPGKRIPGPRLAVLARHLSIEGDLEAAPAALRSPSRWLRDALKRFQRRNGLKENGTLDAGTLAALNVPVADRIRSIELNLERWRWIPADLGARYVLVNVPAFTLDVVERGEVRMAMRVVVGRKFSPRPIFSDRITQVVFSPYWNLPETIVKDEILPAWQKDEGYLERLNIEVLRGQEPVEVRDADLAGDELEGLTFRQRPGPGNSLGRVKFVFPNQFDVYLHDTPAGALFAAEQRTFSHGCIRVEKPAELAQYILGDQPQWTPDNIQAAMASGQEQAVALKAPLPVHIVYWTAWVEQDGVHFRSDVYGHDEEQQRALARRPPPLVRKASSGT